MTTVKKKRIWELDFTRGFLIILMLIDHLFMTVYCFFGPEWFYLTKGADSSWNDFYRASSFYIQHDARTIIHPIVVMIFVILCGFSTGFSRSNLMRAIKMAFLSIAITTITFALGIDEMIITFGIIHLLTTLVAVWAIIDFVTKRLKEDNKLLNLIVGIVISIILAGLYLGATANPSFKAQMANDLYIMIETPSSFDLSPGDFFPILPWAGLFFIAAGLSPYIYKEKKSLLPSLDEKWNKPICFIGRHTLLIYALHILMIVALLELISYFEFGIWLFIDQL